MARRAPRRRPDKARKNPVVEVWYSSLKGDAKKFAKQLFGKIGDVPIAKESERIELRDSDTLMPLDQPAQLAQSIRDVTLSSNVDD